MEEKKLNVFIPFGTYPDLVSEAISGRKEGNVLFKDALNTSYLRLYGIGHMVKNHSYSEKGRKRFI